MGLGWGLLALAVEAELETALVVFLLVLCLWLTVLTALDVAVGGVRQDGTLWWEVRWCDPDRWRLENA